MLAPWQFQVAIKGDHEHPPQHHELALGEIDDAGGIMNDGKTDGNQRIRASGGQTREGKLKQLKKQ